MLRFNQVSLRLKIIAALVFVAILLELIFDPIEIILGNFLFWTNRIRPQIGRLWVEEQKDRTGSTEVSALSATTSKKFIAEPVQDISQLRTLIEIQGQVVISRRGFLSIYKNLPQNKAAEIVPPMDLLEIEQGNAWEYVRFVDKDSLLNVYLLNGSGQVLFDAYPRRDVLGPESREAKHARNLDNDPDFQGRIVAAELFHAAFAQLPRSLRTQVINNPYKLIQWGDDLKRVAISRFVINGAVPIVFEVNQGGVATTYAFQARELAVGYLIKRINQLNNRKTIDMPVQRKK